MKIAVKILKGVVNTIFGVFVAAALAVLVLNFCGIKPYITMSGSMEPNIHTGSVCFVNTKAEYSDIEVGDVIAFKTNLGGLVTHRAIAITGEGIETQGYANDVTDGISTTAENFHGKTLFSVPYAGYALKYMQEFVKKPANLIILAIIVVAIAVVIFMDDSEEKAKKEPSEEADEEKIKNTNFDEIS